MSSECPIVPITFNTLNLWSSLPSECPTMFGLYPMSGTPKTHYLEGTQQYLGNTQHQKPLEFIVKGHSTILKLRPMPYHISNCCVSNGFKDLSKQCIPS